MPVTMFSEEYKLARDALKAGGFAGALKAQIDRLTSDIGVEGPAPGAGPKLDALRTALSLKEEQTILYGAGLAPGNNAVPDAAAVKRIAAAKFLRHLHMAGASGAQTVWVYSNPKDYEKFTYDVIDEAKASSTSLESALSKKQEFFDGTTKARLAEATKIGLAWCQKTLATLAEVKTKKEAREKLDRWFGPGDAGVDKLVADLTDGFKKITATLNDNLIVLTDYPPDRKNAKKDYVEAYVFNLNPGREKPKAIYIEKALYSNFDISVLHDMKKNWVRVIVHECTHICAETKDLGYAYRGIKPGVKIKSQDAANNADSWAFFAGDCGGALVENEINRALNGTGGNLNKLDANWK